MFDTSYSIPVLFLIFNRTEEALKILDVIRTVKPAILYIAADGPRKGNQDDVRKCDEVRTQVLGKIDWPCKVNKLFRNDNLGCKSAVSGAINWFFEHEEMGVILEDDCLANQSFFSFCEEMLNMYRNDKEIIAINGCNFNFSPGSSGSYFFSRYMNVWGWATWKRAAKMIDYNITSWNKKSKLFFLWNRLRNNFFDFDLGWYKYWQKNLDAVASGNLNTWDYQWQYYQWVSKTKTIVASKNLVINIGFGADATHTSIKTHPAATLLPETLNFPVKETLSTEIDKDYEEVSIKPLWHLYSRKSNKFYLLNYINTLPIVQYFRSKIEI